MIYLAIVALGSLLPLSTPTSTAQLSENPDYRVYHKSINRAEQAIAQEKYAEALSLYQEVFGEYDFVFLRDLKVAAQLAGHLDRKEKAMELLRSALASGWTVKGAQKNDLLSQSLNKNQWRTLADAEDSLRGIYERRIDAALREEVHEMFKKDQRKALGVFLKIREKSRDRYTLKTFAPHSEGQMRQLLGILQAGKYPGEWVIGNNYWMSTIISHHNSISPEYNQTDTLYAYVRPMLLVALQNGDLSPYELALMDDWRIAITTDRQGVGYGFLESPKRSTLPETNAKRQALGLRTVELRNTLVGIQEKTGMNFFLPDWVKGAIEVQGG